jgi:hypothetical protein
MASAGKKRELKGSFLPDLAARGGIPPPNFSECKAGPDPTDASARSHLLTSSINGRHDGVAGAARTLGTIHPGAARVRVDVLK